MKYIILLFFSFSFLHVQAQDTKFNSVDSLIFHLYDVISGEAGESRDWDLFRDLFLDDAKLIPVRRGDSLTIARYLSVEEFISNAGAYMETNGFHEKEIYRASESFGNIMHVFSTYETYNSTNDALPSARGINSIQMLFDNNRWWIVNIYWQAESPGLELPENYLPK